jgi:ComF family protein
MNLAMTLRRVGAAAVALLFPARCSACDAPTAEDTAFCITCGLTVEALGPACTRCGIPMPSAARCLGCLQRPPPYSVATAPFQFGGALARAIRRLKWGEQPELARPLGRLVADAAGALAVERAHDALVPVPLHPRRLRERQFNQAALIALEARRARPSLPPVEVDLLERVRDTPPQTRLGVLQRRENVRGAFTARSVVRRRLLLIDDVLTTGATAEACAMALLDGGASEVAVLTLARAVT